MSQQIQPEGDKAPQTRPARHLAAVATPSKNLDRRAQSFVPVYTELFRTGFDASGRRGYGLSGSVAVFFSVIVHMLGTPSDGRRQSRSEAEGKERFSARNPSAGELSRLYGWTYDEIQSWAQTCASPHACPHCDRAHPLLRIERRTGHRNRYAIVRCQELADHECLPISLTARSKRTPTGAADPSTRVLRDDPQVGLPFEEARQTLGLSPKVKHDEKPPTVGQTPKVSGQPVAPRDPSPVAFEEPQTDLDARVMVLRGFARLHGSALDTSALVAIASAIQAPEELLQALIYIIAAASLQKVTISATYVTEALAKRDQQGRAGENGARRDSDWATERILELAQRREPHTTFAQARALREEFFSRCLEHVGGDVALAEDEIARIITDPRVCGAFGREAPQKPIAMLRDGFKKGWIWTHAGDDDGNGPLARTFERLPPGDQCEIERLFRAARGGALDYTRLKQHAVGSKQMIAYLRQRFSDSSTG